ncbi:MAG: UDP-2,3-diacylglucosamine diphosphatase [Campylobacterales bacterium]|nr:UDP-2,3-diacylglucosamine diphosphatase [Campylobacterales bacterium]
MHYRSIFISDVHLGSRHAQAEALLEFMKDNESDALYLVGDIIDGWALKRRWVWPQAHSDVVQKLLRKARKGTRVVYVLGNHDEFVRSFLPLNLGDNLEILNETVYTDLHGRRYLVTHGDFFDSITMTKKWLAKFGDISYNLLLKLNRPINTCRRIVGYKRYWSLSAYAKQNVKKAVMFIDDFEKVLCIEAQRRHLDGVICGHIHHAEHKQIENITYLNCGDWVESATAVVETMEGEWQIVRFHEVPSEEH